VALCDKTVTNPESRIAEAIGLFDARAPEVTLEVHVGTINEIQKGVMDGRFNVGVIPTHRASPSLDYLPLFREHMYLYAGKGHRLFDADRAQISPDILRQHKFAGLGYNSPNMEVGNRKGIERHASCYDQEAVATLVLSGRYLGFLPDHYAASFHAQGLLRVLERRTYTYVCDFDAITCRSPRPARVAQLFLDCLEKAHGKVAQDLRFGKDRG
jgi:DNA-binding transcriptional LysR family regulator